FILQGFSIGKGTTSNTLLMKPVTINVRNNQDFFIIGNAYATRSLPNIEWASTIVPITNITSGKAFSFIKMESVEYKDTQRTVLAEGLSFVTGSVGILGSVQTNTCLAPFETGYFLLLKNDLYSDLAVVEFDLEYMTWEVNNPDARILPTDVTYTPDIISDLISVKFMNYGNATAIVGNSSQYILLSDAMIPLDWGFMDSNLSPFFGTVYPLASGSVEDSLIYAGSATRIIPFIDFEDESTTGKTILLTEPYSKSSTSRQEYEETLLDLRNTLEEIKNKALLEK
ncbi:hypothetical protein LCGC14_2731760, partial [marine sediment metagenome]